MTKENVSLFIAILTAIIASILLLTNFKKTVELKLENKTKSTISLGYQDQSDILYINIPMENIYTALSNNYDETNISKYTNDEYVEDDIEWVTSLLDRVMKNVDYKIYESKLKEYRYTEIISYGNVNTSNPFVIKYKLLKNKDEYNDSFYENANSENGKINVNDMDIQYHIDHVKENKNNVYDVVSILPINDDNYLFIQIYYENINNTNFENLKELLKTIYKNIYIVQNDIVQDTVVENKEEINQSELNKKIMYCTNTQTFNEYEGTYIDIIYFENNICIKYEMKTVEKYFDYNTYQKYKQYLTTDDSFDDDTLTLTHIVGDGHIGLNGNEELFRNKTLEEAKTIASKYGKNNCEVK